MIKKKLAIYPFSKEVMPLVRCQRLLDHYTVLGVVASRTLIQPNEDLSCIDGGNYLNLTAENNFLNIIQEVDTVWIDDSQPLSKDILNELYDLNKEIIRFSELKASDLSYAHKQVEELDKLHNISIPVIFVFGMGENCNKFDIQLALRQHFLEKGYRVAQIGTKAYSQLVGFQSLPESMFRDNLSIEKKIYMFNQYVKNLVENQDFDLIIIGVPGAIIKYNNKITNKFCEAFYVISNAVSPDISVLSVYYDDFDINYIKKIMQYCYYKFDCEIDYINIANSKIVIRTENYKDPISFLTINSSDILSFSSEFSDQDAYMFNILDNDSRDAFCKSVEESLQDNTPFV